jgi:hypothetical protein
MTRHSILRGLGGGLVALVPMSAWFAVAQREGALDEFPPGKAAGAVFGASSKPARSLLGAGAHMLIGGSVGAAYGAAPDRVRHGIPTGIVAGCVVWLIGYELVMPRLTDMPPAHRDRRDRAGAILVAHLIFGSVLGATVDARATPLPSGRRRRRSS